MTWEIAFTIVGCVWALVVLVTTRFERQREHEIHLNRVDAVVTKHEKQLNWLEEIWRNNLSK